MKLLFFFFTKQKSDTHSFFYRHFYCTQAVGQFWGKVPGLVAPVQIVGPPLRRHCTTTWALL